MMRPVNDVDEVEIPLLAGAPAAQRPLDRRILRYSALSSAFLAVGGLGPQFLLSKWATLLGVRSLAIGLISDETGVIEPMLSDDLPHLQDDPGVVGNIRNTYFSHVLFGLAATCLSIPVAVMSPQWMRACGIVDLDAADTATLQKTLAYDYPAAFMSVFIDLYLLFLFQARKMEKATALIAVSELSQLAFIAILTQATGMGFELVGLANLSSSVLAGLLIAYFELKDPPIGQSIFNLKTPATVSLADKSKLMFKLGTTTWLAGMADNLSGVYSMRFASIGLQGALGVLDGAFSNVSSVVMDIFSPYIAESRGQERRQKVLSQLAWGIAPSLVLSAIAIPFAKPLSQLLDGGALSEESDGSLTGNVALYMAGSLLGNLFDILYATFIDCELTTFPAAIAFLTSFWTIGFCFAFESLLGDDSNITANAADLCGTALALIPVAFYAYHKSDALFGSNQVEENVEAEVV